jgi:OHCU decarboxylase
VDSNPSPNPYAKWWYIVDIHTLNSLPDQQFLAHFAGIYEASFWVAQRALKQRPFACVTALTSELRKIVEDADPALQLTLLRSHPELARRAQMSSDSMCEQRNAGLDELTPQEREHLIHLNAKYYEKFGFPFILAVKHKDKNDIQSNLKERLGSSLAEEFRRALDEVHLIAQFRLHTLLTPEV